MPLNPLPLIGIASNISGLLGGNKDRKRNREFARRGGAISTAQIDLNRERAQEELRQFAVDRNLQGQRDRGQIIAATNVSGVVSSVRNRLTAINQGNEDRDIANRATNVALQNEGFDLQQQQVDLGVEQSIANNEALSPFEIATGIINQPNINAVRSAFGLR